jgi:Family of unknown function (DUF6491)
MKARTLLLGLSLALVALSAQARHGQIDYAAYAGDPIPEFRFTKLYNWQRTGDKTVVIWTKPSTAYLLTTRNNCDALSGRVTVEIGGVDGIDGRLQAGSGDIIVGQLRCRVVAIQPLDLQRLKADRAAKQ